MRDPPSSRVQSVDLTLNLNRHDGLGHSLSKYPFSSVANGTEIDVVSDN